MDVLYSLVSKGGGVLLNGGRYTPQENSAPTVIVPFGPWTSEVARAFLDHLEHRGHGIIKAPSAIGGHMALFQGKSAVYFGDREKLWETAPSSLLVEEAGGFALSAPSDLKFDTLIIPNILSFSLQRAQEVQDAWNAFATFAL